MSLADTLKAISKGEIPKGLMVVRTRHGATKVELYGQNQKGFSIPLDQVDGFLRELEQMCTNPQTLYVVGKKENPVEIPGFKVPKIRQYLEEARDDGVKLAQYQMVF